MWTVSHEQEKEDWAEQMHDLLISANKEVENHIEQKALPAEVVLEIEQTLVY